MLTFGMVVLFGAYTVGGYGWVLLKGWDIPFRSWVSPLNPYQWPKDGTEPPTIPGADLFPSGASSAGGAGVSTDAGAATQPATAAGDKSPGNVPIRTQ